MNDNVYVNHKKLIKIMKDNEATEATEANDNNQIIENTEINEILKKINDEMEIKMDEIRKHMEIERNKIRKEMIQIIQDIKLEMDDGKQKIKEEIQILMEEIKNQLKGNDNDNDNDILEIKRFLSIPSNKNESNNTNINKLHTDIPSLSIPIIDNIKVETSLINKIPIKTLARKKQMNKQITTYNFLTYIFGSLITFIIYHFIKKYIGVY